MKPSESATSGGVCSYLFLPFFVAFFFVATDLTSFRVHDLGPPTELVLPCVTAFLGGIYRAVTVAPVADSSFA